MILRDYQQLCSDAILKEFSTGPSTLIVLPTGCGKTIVFSDIIRRMHPQRAMVLAHRSELIYQAKEKIEHVTGFRCEIEMAELFAEHHNLYDQQAPVIVSTVQTQISGGELNERMRRFNPNDFGLLIIDECHHTASKSYRKLVDYYRKNPDLKVLGVTATPDRTDELALGEIFETVAFDYEIIDAIHNGYLVPIDQQFVKVHDLDFSKVKTQMGDLNGADLAALMEQERNMQEVAGASIQIIGNKKALIFTASVKQAETLCEILNRHKSDMAGWVCGKTNKQDRKNILDDFQTGKLQVVVNCGVLTEGYDNPSVEVVIMARPTKSRSLYSQMVGRGTRTLTGTIDGKETAEDRKLAIEFSKKPSLLVVDFVGNSGKHKLMTSADILGGKSSEEAIEKAKEKAKKSGSQVRMSDMLDEAESEIKQAQELKRQQEEARKARLVAQAKYSMESISPFDQYQVKYQAPSEWEKNHFNPLSEKQRVILKNMGVDPDAVSISCGKKMIAARFSQPTPKQIGILTRFRYPTTCTMKEASAIIDRIVAAGWKRPQEDGPGL